MNTKMVYKVIVINSLYLFIVKIILTPDGSVYNFEKMKKNLILK